MHKSMESLYLLEARLEETSRRERKYFPVIFSNQCIRNFLPSRGTQLYPVLKRGSWCSIYTFLSRVLLFIVCFLFCWSLYCPLVYTRLQITSVISSNFHSRFNTLLLFVRQHNIQTRIQTITVCHGLVSHYKALLYFSVVNMQKILDSDVKRNTKTKMKLSNVYGEAGILIIRRLESQII